MLDLPEPDHTKEGKRFRRRFLSLAFEAFRREDITRAKLEELSEMLGTPAQSMLDILEGLGRDKPTGVEVPE